MPNVAKGRLNMQLEILRLAKMLKDANISHEVNKITRKDKKYSLIGEPNIEVYSYYIFCYKHNNNKKKDRLCTIEQTSDNNCSNYNRLMLRGLFIEKEKNEAAIGLDNRSAEDVMERILNHTNKVAQKNFDALKLEANDQFLFRGIKYRINADGCVCLCPDQYRDINIIHSSLFETMLNNPGDIKIVAWKPLLNNIKNKSLWFSGRVKLRACKGDTYYYIDKKQGDECFKKVYGDDIIDSYLMDDNNYYQTLELAAKSVIG